MNADDPGEDAYKGQPDKLGIMSEEQLDQVFPDRPRNTGPSLAFHELPQLFSQLNAIRQKPAARIIPRAKVGPHGPAQRSPKEQKRVIIERFISRWRQQVGNDIHPAFRLIIPDKDRDRPMYGLKEKAVAKLLVRVMKLEKTSEDGAALLNWRVPGRTFASRLAGDFPGLCHGIILKRERMQGYGKLSIADVNEMLDRLAVASKEDEQIPIIRQFYNNMNSEELVWLIRIILRQMRIGATEKSIFEIWHPDADKLFNLSSSLRRVCWELWDPRLKLNQDDAGVEVMSCFRPQLAQFQPHSFSKMIERMRLDENNPVFWIEEKLDGERMQLHMQLDPNIEGGMRFKFWSRRAKEYTYLYGDGLFSQQAALTVYLRNAFHSGVSSIILDGEMITWDPIQEALVPFGTLKTAALSEQANPFTNGHRPLMKVFDCLYLSGKSLIDYTLADRRNALESSVKGVPGRLEIHTRWEACSSDDIERRLRKVIETSSEGLVLKNPISPYRLNQRNDDWVKVKPEYMTEFGESLECLIIGGYHGQGKRGGFLASFLCGLRADEPLHARSGKLVFKSFVKVGGGFSASDYQHLRHHTADKWVAWDDARPPPHIELAMGVKREEVPHHWIRPQDSIVIAIKAAQVVPADEFAAGCTLRFPRFQTFCPDKDWESALSIRSFRELRQNIEKESLDNKLQLDQRRVRRSTRQKRPKFEILGQQSGPHRGKDVATSDCFSSSTFCVMTEVSYPRRLSKVQLESLIKDHGGAIVQRGDPESSVICIAARNTVQVAALKKNGSQLIVSPTWIFDSIAQHHLRATAPNFVLPFEPRHLYWSSQRTQKLALSAVDSVGDSFARDLAAGELRRLCKTMKPTQIGREEREKMLSHYACEDLSSMPLRIFDAAVVLLVTGPRPYEGDIEPPSDYRLRHRKERTGNILVAGGATLAKRMQCPSLSHIVCLRENREAVSYWQSATAKRINLGPIPRVVSSSWVYLSWRERTRLDEERFRLTP